MFKVKVKGNERYEKSNPDGAPTREGEPNLKTGMEGKGAAANELFEELPEELLVRTGQRAVQDS
jgi:hypothetical protein